MIVVINNEAKELRILGLTNTANGKQYFLDGNSNSIWIEKDKPTKYIALTQLEAAMSKTFIITKVEFDGVSYSVGDKVTIKNGDIREIFGFHYNNGVKINGIEWRELSISNNSNVVTDNLTLKKSESITTSADGASLLDMVIKNAPIKSGGDDLDLLKMPINSSFLVKEKTSNVGIIYEFLLSNRTSRGYLYVVNKGQDQNRWISSDDFLELYEVIDICPEK